MCKFSHILLQLRKVLNYKMFCIKEKVSAVYMDYVRLVRANDLKHLNIEQTLGTDLTSEFIVKLSPRIVTLLTFLATRP